MGWDNMFGDCKIYLIKKDEHQREVWMENGRRIWCSSKNCAFYQI